VKINERLSLVIAACALLLIVPLVATDLAGASAAADAPVSVTLPLDARSFGPGPGQSVAQANCTICHAADYVYMQPALTDVQWRAEVMKMKTAYGAPLNDSDVDTLVAYLVGQNGKK
jgi:mono/diheme cytochrome c family protein